MLSYQHGYHAGNFADVVKHLVLSRILHLLCQKEKPLFYFETHAGRGLYALQSKEAQKNAEFKNGIAQIWPHRQALPPGFSEYLQAILHYNPSGALTIYPGSPAIALQLLRPSDQIYCCELHPAEYAALTQLKSSTIRLHHAHACGLSRLQALLPLALRRGLIFIDPSYEMKTDYQAIPKYVASAYQKFATGVYCIWYPVLKRGLHQQMCQQLRTICPKKWLKVEFNCGESHEEGMTATGLWIMNPPYRLQEELPVLLDGLITFINPGHSFYQIEHSEEGA